MMDDESSVAPEFFSCSRKACNGKQLRFHQRDLIAHQTLFRSFGFNSTLGGGCRFLSLYIWQTSDLAGNAAYPHDPLMSIIGGRPMVLWDAQLAIMRPQKDVSWMMWMWSSWSLPFS
jgi:hypothetical protein